MGEGLGVAGSEKALVDGGEVRGRGGAPDVLEDVRVPPAQGGHDGRVEALAQIEADRPLIYLYHQALIFAHSAKLEGYKQMPDGLVRVIGLKLK